MRIVFRELDGYKGMVKVAPDGFITIVLDSRLNIEMQKRALLHELNHLKNNDLHSNLSVSEIEMTRHR